MKKQTVTLQQFKAAQKNLINLAKTKKFKFEQDELTFTAEICWDGDDFVNYLITDVFHKNKAVNRFVGEVEDIDEVFHVQYGVEREIPKALWNEKNRIEKEVKTNLKVIEAFGVNRENWEVKNPETAKSNKSPNREKFARVYVSYDSNKYPKFDQNVIMLFEDFGGEQFGCGLGFGRRDLDGCILRSNIELFKKALAMIDKSIIIEKVV